MILMGKSERFPVDFPLNQPIDHGIQATNMDKTGILWEKVWGDHGKMVVSWEFNGFFHYMDNTWISMV